MVLDVEKRERWEEMPNRRPFGKGDHNKGLRLHQARGSQMRTTELRYNAATDKLFDYKLALYVALPFGDLSPRLHLHASEPSRTLVPSQHFLDAYGFLGASAY